MLQRPTQNTEETTGLFRGISISTITYALLGSAYLQYTWLDSQRSTRICVEDTRNKIVALATSLIAIREAVSVELQRGTIILREAIVVLNELRIREKALEQEWVTINNVDVSNPSHFHQKFAEIGMCISLVIFVGNTLFWTWSSGLSRAQRDQMKTASLVSCLSFLCFGMSLWTMHY